jgi:hypothetical protein
VSTVTTVVLPLLSSMPAHASALVSGSPPALDLRRTMNTDTESVLDLVSATV